MWLFNYFSLSKNGVSHLRWPCFACSGAVRGGGPCHRQCVQHVSLTAEDFVGWHSTVTYRFLICSPLVGSDAGFVGFYLLARSRPLLQDLQLEWETSKVRAPHEACVLLASDLCPELRAQRTALVAEGSTGLSFKSPRVAPPSSACRLLECECTVAVGLCLLLSICFLCFFLPSQPACVCCI